MTFIGVKYPLLIIPFRDRGNPKNQQQSKEIMNFTEQDNLIHKGGAGLVDAQLRVQSLTHNILKDMSKEELLEIIKNMNSDAYYMTSGTKNVRQFMIEYEMYTELVIEDKKEAEKMIKDLIA